MDLEKLDEVKKSILDRYNLQTGDMFVLEHRDNDNQSKYNGKYFSVENGEIFCGNDVIVDDKFVYDIFFHYHVCLISKTTYSPLETYTGFHWDYSEDDQCYIISRNVDKRYGTNFSTLKFYTPKSTVSDALMIGLTRIINTMIAITKNFETTEDLWR